MAVYFMVRDAVLVNRILLDEGSEYDPGEGVSLVSATDLPEGASGGWVKSNGRWVPPESSLPVVPATVTPRQLRLALHVAGRLDQVEAFVASGAAPTEAKISWEYATEFLRSDPMLGQFAAMLEMSEEDVDALFVAAAQIQ